MLGMASVPAVPSVVDCAVLWLSVTFTVLMNIYENKSTIFMHVHLASFTRRSFHLMIYERNLMNA